MPDAPPSRPAFQALQLAFAAHIRAPENPLPAGVPAARMAVYRELFFNNVKGFLDSAFPVLSKTLGPDIWHARVADFFARHACHTPYFKEIPEEFIAYLQACPTPADPPWIHELAHYEWAELYLSVAPDADLTGIDPTGDLLAGTPVLSPLAMVMAYQYPVHRIGPGVSPAPQPTFLAVARTPDDAVRFLELSPAMAHFISLLQQDNQNTGAELVARIPATPGTDPRAALDHLRHRGVLLGTKKAGH
jgi:hypothetical protein